MDFEAPDTPLEALTVLFCGCRPDANTLIVGTFFQPNQLTVPDANKVTMPDGTEYIMSGDYYNGYGDSILASINTATGQLIRSMKIASGQDHIRIRGVATMNDKLYVSGDFTGTAVFKGKTATTITKTYAGGFTDIFVAKVSF